MRYLLAAACLLCCFTIASAQSSDMYTINRPFAEPLVILGMRADTAGNVFMANYGSADYTSSVDLRYPIRHHISSYDAAGRFRWQRQYWAGGSLGGRGQSFARCPQTGNLFTMSVVDTLPASLDSVRYSHLRIDCISSAGRHLWSRLLKYPARMRGYGMLGYRGGVYVSLYLGPVAPDSAVSLRNRQYVARLRADGSVAFCRELPTAAAEDPALSGQGLQAQGLCTTPRGVIWMGAVLNSSFSNPSYHNVLIELDTNGRNPASHSIYWPYQVFMGVPRYHAGKLYFTGTNSSSFSGQLYKNFVGRVSYPDFALERGFSFGIGTQGTTFTAFADQSWDVLSNGEVALCNGGPEFRSFGGFTGTSTAFFMRLDTALVVKHAFEYRGICTAPFRSTGEGCVTATNNGRYVAATYRDSPVNQSYWQNGVFAPDTSDRVCTFQRPLALQLDGAFVPGYDLQPARTLPELPTIALRSEPALWLADSQPQPNMRQVCRPTPARWLGIRLLGPDTTLCQLSYTTSIVGGMVSIDGAPFAANPGQVTFTASGLHTITVFDSCNASDYLTDTLQLVLGSRLVGLPDTTINACAGDTIVVGASPQGPGPFLWRDESGGQVQTTRLGRFVFSDTGRRIAYHKVFYTGQLGCISTDSQVVAVSPRLPRTLPDSIFLCPGKDTLLSGATWYAGVPVFLWTSPSNQVSAFGFNASAPGRYRLAFFKGGCAQRDSLFIKQLPIPPPITLATALAQPCADTIPIWIISDSTRIPGPVIWRQDGQIWVDETGFDVMGSRGHSYVAQVSTVCGSSISPALALPLRPRSCEPVPPPPAPALPIQIPNLVTANGDGIDDFFEIKNALPTATYHLDIVNRWGSRVYSDTYVLGAWPTSGTPPGVFFYRLTTDQGEFKGWVEVTD